MLTVKREDVVTEARRWLETRWVHQGRSEAGIDCAGLLLMVGTALGLRADDMEGYRRSPNGQRFRDHIFEQTTYEPHPQPGLIGLFRETHYPTHTGIFAEKDGVLTLIHAYMPYGKVMEEPFLFEWPKQLVAVRSFIGVVE